MVATGAISVVATLTVMLLWPGRSRDPAEHAAPTPYSIGDTGDR
jgi:hypothetical protein